MERRRRRPQAEQNPELQQREDIQPAASPEEPACWQPDVPAVQTPARRRRNAQVASEQIQQADECDGNMRERAGAHAADSASPRERIRPKTERIPQLPKAEVQVEKTKRSGQRPVKAPSVKAKDAEVEAAKRRFTPKAGKVRARSAKHSSADMIQKAVSGAKTVSGWLIGAALLLLMMAGEGAEKLSAWVFSLKEGRKSRIREDGHAPKPEEYVLEAIRPQDYHGRAQSRNGQAHHGAHGQAQRQSQGQKKASGGRKGPGGIKAPDMQQLISLALAGVAVFSFCMIVSILWRTVRTTHLNKQLTQMYNEASSDGENPPEMIVYAPETTPEMIVFMPQETAAQDDAAIAATVEASLTDNQPAAPQELVQPEQTPVPADMPLPMGKRTYHQVGGDALPQMEALHKENRDIVGWLKIENVLDQPVVYKDNSYYLTRDFYKKKNTAGTIFLDVNHPFKEKTQNLLLHGHNMKDGTMFGRLLQYETDLNYVRWHPFVRFDTLWRQEEYVIFAVLRVSLDVRSKDFFNYFSHPTFNSDAEFESYIRQLQLRSIYAIPVDVKPTDALLTMSTCLDEDRLVIVARRLRKGETHTQIREWTNLTTKQ